MPDETIFGEAVDQSATIDPEKDYFSELVGDGKKYKDPVAAGRALVEKDAFISTVTQENASLREELNKRKSVQEIMDQVVAARTTPPSTPANNQNRPEERAQENNNQPKVEDIVRQEVEKISAAGTVAQNQRQVVDVLRSQWGPGFAKAIADKAVELGVGAKYIEDLAGRSPKAALQLLGVNENATRTVTPAAGARTNPGTVNGNGRKNFKFYQAVRKTDPERYRSVGFTQEMLQAATEQGDDFYR